MRIDRSYVRAAMSAGAVLTAILTAGGCTSSDENTAAGPAGSGVSDQAAPGRPQSADPGAEERRAGRATGSIPLGDLDKPKSAGQAGAPFDPCGSDGLDWADWPAPVRPTDGKPHAPTQIKPGGDGTGVQCRWDNSGAITIGPGGSSAPQGGLFTTTIAWGRDLQTDPAKRPGSTTKTWGGRSGWSLPGNSKSGPTCTAVADLGEGRGAAGVVVQNARFAADAPACDVVDSVINAIVAQVK
ncbi:hypothetical protein [Actinokineospora iranica]|uniref:DUF3558 domain-containing protein n=1 Tax=Actinokineospora iranica TaxID=1271860 RepID=A0A1G6VUT8_9PSEU|nr:hypothetical protein [Actinokineospora iranica]SDD56596.1 hypothetical protein SAMN05216174_11375 [Actinokineospora iranica]